MSEHTPGPWTSEHLDGTSIWYVRTNHQRPTDPEAVETVIFDAGIGGNVGQTTYRSNAEADARLIAAAPALLEAARAALVYLLAEPARDEAAVSLLHRLDRAILDATTDAKPCPGFLPQADAARRIATVDGREG